MSDQTPLAVVILAAGNGSRMKSDTPKVLHKIAGKPMISWLLDHVRALAPAKIITVASPQNQEAVAAYIAPVDTVIQKTPQGTADAVKAALPHLADFTGDILILAADMPFLTPETLQNLVTARHANRDTGLAVLGAAFDQPPAFGRMVAAPDGTLVRIIEHKDCTPDERAITLCSMGAFCVDGARLEGWLAQVGNDNAQKEFYLPEIVTIAAAEGVKTGICVTGDKEEIYGANDRAELAVLESIIQRRLRLGMMKSGVTLMSPDSVYFSHDTVIAPDVTIEPHVFFGTGVTVGAGTIIHGFSHLEGVTIGEHARIGPFARIRPQSVIEDGAVAGNFIEINRSHMKAGSKAKHFSYLGDTVVGAKANIGAGTVIANYDGYEKHRTTIGDGAFIGSNSTLVAPLAVGDGAIIAAGSTITASVPDDALAIARIEGDIRPGWAVARHKRKKAG